MESHNFLKDTEAFQWCCGISMHWKQPLFQQVCHVLWQTTEEISTKLEEEALQAENETGTSFKKVTLQDREVCDVQRRLRFYSIFFLSSNQNSLGLVCSEGPPTLCHPFRGHFRFFNMKPSCLSGLWTLLCPIFRPSTISQLSASCRGAESVVWGINPPRINPKFETPTPL